MTEEVYYTYMPPLEALIEFVHDPDITETQCYNRMLGTRSVVLTAKDLTLQSKQSPYDRALLRLLCIAATEGTDKPLRLLFSRKEAETYFRIMI